MIHVPLVLAGPSGNGTADELVGLLDVAPTIVEYADGTRPANFYGRSLRSLVEADEWDRESIVGDWSTEGPNRGERRYAYRDDRWKYIVDVDVNGNDRERLFDLVADPGEHENVAAEHSSTIDRCRAAIDAHERTVAATATDLGTVEMDEDVKERLRDLGYRE